MVEIMDTTYRRLTMRTLGLGRGAKKRSNFTSNSNELVGVFRRRESHSSIEDDYQVCGIHYGD